MFIIYSKLIVEIMCKIYGNFEMSDRDVLENLFFSDFLELSISHTILSSSLYIYIYIVQKHDKACA